MWSSKRCLNTTRQSAGRGNHDLSADEYRAAFGLMKKTKLVAPALRKAQSERAAEHLRRIGGPHRETIENLSTEERRQRALKAERRVEHDLNSPEPERADSMLEPHFGLTKSPVLTPEFQRARGALIIPQTLGPLGT